MRLIRGLFAVSFLASVFALPARGAEFNLANLAAFTGEFSGKFNAFAVAGSPEVAWKLKVTWDGPTRKNIEVDLVTEAGKLRFRANLDALSGDGTWEIVEGKLDAAAWLVIFAPRLGKLSSGVIATGNLELSGRGVVNARRPAGVARIVWSEGSLRNKDEGWILDGITFKGDIALDTADLAAMNSSTPWELSIGTISSNRFGARNLFIRAQFNQNRTVSLLLARVEVAGGNVTVDPSTVSLIPPVLDFNVRIDRVGLQDLVALVPGSVSEAKGRIDGVVRLGWSQTAGLQIGLGRFELRDDEVATFRLEEAPGFLTQRIPERLTLLPKWVGPVRQWLATPNPVYGDVRQIELGKTELQIVSFSLALNPKGDELSRTGVLKISARPTTEGGVVKLVRFDLNIFGSISDLLQHSMINQVSFELR